MKQHDTFHQLPPGHLDLGHLSPETLVPEASCCCLSTSLRRGSPSSLPALPAARGSSAPTATCTRTGQQSAPVWCRAVLYRCPSAWGR